VENLPYGFEDVRSPLKLFILEKVEENGSVTANDIAQHLQTSSETPETHAGKYLLQYSRQGLLRRRKEHKYYVYELTDSGKNRLDYLKSQAEE